MTEQYRWNDVRPTMVGNDRGATFTAVEQGDDEDEDVEDDDAWNDDAWLTSYDERQAQCQWRQHAEGEDVWMDGSEAWQSHEPDRHFAGYGDD